MGTGKMSGATVRSSRRGIVTTSLATGMMPRGIGFLVGKAFVTGGKARGQT